MKESILQKIKQIWKDSDIYGQSVQIHLGKKKKHKTLLGALFTLFTVLIMSIALYYIIDDLIWKNNPTIISQENLITDQNSYYHTIQSLSLHITFHGEDGRQLSSKQFLSSITSYFSFQLFNLHKTDISIELKSALGTNQNYPSVDVFYFYPDLSDEIYKNQFLDINQFSNNEWVLSLSVNEKIKETEAYFLNIQYMDSYTNLENNKEPLQIYEKSFYCKLRSGEREHITAHFKQKQIETDIGWIYNDYVLNTEIYQEDAAMHPISNDQSEIYMIDFILNRKQSVIKRSYLKIQGALVQLGGLLKAVVLFFSVLSYPLTKLSLQVELVNSIFQFEEEESTSMNLDQHVLSQLQAEENQDKQLQIETKNQQLIQQKLQNGDDLKTSISKYKLLNPTIKIPSKQQYPLELQTQSYQNINSGINKISHHNFSQSMNNNKDNFLLKTNQYPIYENNLQSKQQKNTQTNFNNINDSSNLNNNQRKDSLFKIENIDKSICLKEQQLNEEIENHEIKQIDKNEDQSIKNFSGRLHQSLNQQTKTGQNLQDSLNNNFNQQKMQEQILSEKSNSLSPKTRQKAISLAQAQQLQSYTPKSNRSLFKQPQDQRTQLIKKIARQNFARKKPHLLNLNSPESPLKTIEFQQARSLVKGKKNEDFNSIFTKLFKTISHNYLVMKVLDKIKYLCNLRFPKQQQLKFSMNKIKERLDIIFIMKKIVEIDKLKMVLFDQNQLKIFEYLPRPVIKFDPYNFEKNQQQKELSRVKNPSQSYYKQNNNNNNNIDNQNMTSSREYKMEGNIHEVWQYALLESDKPYFVKVQEAARAYEQVNQKQNKDIYDQRLLQFLDDNRKHYFQDILNPSSPSSCFTQKQKLKMEILKQDRLDFIPEYNNSDKNIEQTQSKIMEQMILKDKLIQEQVEQKALEITDNNSDNLMNSLANYTKQYNQNYDNNEIIVENTNDPKYFQNTQILQNNIAKSQQINNDCQQNENSISTFQYIPSEKNSPHLKNPTNNTNMQSINKFYVKDI